MIGFVVGLSSPCRLPASRHCRRAAVCASQSEGGEVDSAGHAAKKEVNPPPTSGPASSPPGTDAGGRGASATDVTRDIVQFVGAVGDRIGVVELGRVARTKVEDSFATWEQMKGKETLSGQDRVRSAVAVGGKALGERTWSAWKAWVSPWIQRRVGGGSDEGIAAVVVGGAVALSLVPILTGWSPPPPAEAPTKVSNVVSNPPKVKAAKPESDAEKELTQLVRGAFGRRKRMVLDGSVDGDVFTARLDNAYTSLQGDLRRKLALSSFDAVQRKGIKALLFTSKAGDVIARTDEMTVVYASQLQLRASLEQLNSEFVQKSDALAQQRDQNASARDRLQSMTTEKAALERELSSQLSALRKKVNVAEAEVEDLEQSVANTPDRNVVVGLIADSDRRTGMAKDALQALSTNLARTRAAEEAANTSAESLSKEIAAEQEQIQAINQDYQQRKTEILAQGQQDADQAAEATRAQLDAQLDEQTNLIERLQYRYEEVVTERDDEMSKVQREFDAAMASLQADTEQQVANARKGSA